MFLDLVVDTLRHRFALSGARLRKTAKSTGLMLDQFHSLPIAKVRSFATSNNIVDWAITLKANKMSISDCLKAITPNTSQDKAENNICAMEIVNSGALMALVSFLQDSDPNASSDLLVPAFLALIRLSADSLLAQELSRLNLEEILIPVLAQTDPRLQTAACLTLGNLALEPTLVDTVSSPQIVHAVLSVLNSRHEAIKRVAITCLANIATYAQGRHRIVEQDGVQLISELLDDEYSDQLRGEAAFSLGNILSGRDINLQDKIRESGVLPSLVLLLSPIFAEDINSSSAWGLYHAVRLNAASQSIVADSGGLGMLVQHIRSGTLESLKTNALLALESVVVKNEKNLAWCRTNGVLKLIHEIDRDELNVNAKQALTSLLEHLI